MPRAKQTDKFYIVKTFGKYRVFGDLQVGVNHSYKGSRGDLSLQAFIDFLREHNVDLAKVTLSPTFTTFASK